MYHMCSRARVNLIKQVYSKLFELISLNVHITPKLEQLAINFLTEFNAVATAAQLSWQIWS